LTIVATMTFGGTTPLTCNLMTGISLEGQEAIHLDWLPPIGMRSQSGLHYQTQLAGKGFTARIQIPTP
ncbi:hypothetical protein FRC02_002066, partial [Tulasnella sp. 418]